MNQTKIIQEVEHLMESKYTRAVSGIIDILGENDLNQMLDTQRRITEIFDNMREGATDEQ
ncbi:hypothetical protein M3201_01425 [Paenibacillus motobuensis]|uniref:hypothetical protein n=1 Tax=Paenibacillus TaxID=44249 RepID=UPI0020415E3E|nr:MULTISPECIES: hypothetical protein [Paenibacillus]MCM3038365.1 hypothetical protein [Paenibacillus lutimineralis]MCM3645469.1 hypothetical protein [Paenibacillus motobuensis]